MWCCVEDAAPSGFGENGPEAGSPRSKGLTCPREALLATPACPAGMPAPALRQADLPPSFSFPMAMDVPGAAAPETSAQSTSILQACQEGFQECETRSWSQSEVDNSMCCLSSRKKPPACQFKSLQDIQQHPRGCIQMLCIQSIPPSSFSPSRVSPCGSLQGCAPAQRHFWGGSVPCASCSRNLWPLPAATLGSWGLLSGICVVELVYLEPFGCLCWNELPGHKMCFPRVAPLPPASLWSTEPPLPHGNAAVIEPYSPNCSHINSDDAEHLL